MVCPSTVQLLLPLIGTSEVVAYFCALCSRGEMWRPVGWRKFKIKFGLYRSYCSKFIYLNTRNKNLKYTMKNVLSFVSTNWTLENKCCNILTQKQIALIAAPCKLSYPLHCFTTWWHRYVDSTAEAPLPDKTHVNFCGNARNTRSTQGCQVQPPRGNATAEETRPSGVEPEGWWHRDEMLDQTRATNCGRVHFSKDKTGEEDAISSGYLRGPLDLWDMGTKVNIKVHADKASRVNV